MNRIACLWPSEIKPGLAIWLFDTAKPALHLQRRQPIRLTRAIPRAPLLLQADRVSHDTAAYALAHKWRVYPTIAWARFESHRITVGFRMYLDEFDQEFEIERLGRDLYYANVFPLPQP